MITGLVRRPHYEEVLAAAIKDKESKHEWENEEAEGKADNSKRQAEGSEGASKEAKRVRITLDDEEIQDMPEWDIFEDDCEEQQPPTEEEEYPLEAGADESESTAGTCTEAKNQAGAPVEERRAVRVGGVISSNEETGEQKRKRIMKQGREDQSKRWEARRANKRKARQHTEQPKKRSDRAKCTLDCLQASKGKKGQKEHIMRGA